MARNVELLLLETVENLGLVGDVVKVKTGYARNYLLPHGVAEPPSPSKIEQLKEQRARAQTELSALRTQREKIIEELTEAHVTLHRSCNDQGSLYGSVTQRDISDALIGAGYGVDVHAVRLSHAIRHIGTYPVPIQFDKDLRVEISLLIKPDRDLEGFDDLGQPIDSDEAEHEGDADRDGDRDKRHEHAHADGDDRPKRTHRDE